MEDLPGSVLFACTSNAIRSPLAAAILQALHPKRIYVASAGVRAGRADPMVDAVLDEIGIEPAPHFPQTFEELEDSFFDVVVALSPEAQHRAVEFSRYHDVELEFWHMPDPSIVEGSREQRLDAYRRLRDQLFQTIRRRFPPQGAPVL